MQTSLEQADRLRGEIALLCDIRESNEHVGRALSEPHRGVLEVEAEGRFRAAVHAGIPEWDADHPCIAIDDRYAELRRVCPDLALREMGAPMLPGMEVVA